MLVNINILKSQNINFKKKQEVAILDYCHGLKIKIDIYIIFSVIIKTIYFKQKLRLVFKSKSIILV